MANVVYNKLEISDFKSNTILTDIVAEAELVRNIITMEKGTNKACLDMGVGIETYVNGFIDDTVLADLELEIMSQVNKYIPDNHISQVSLKEVTLQGYQKAIAILLVLDGRYDYADTNTDSVLLISGKNNKQIISNIIV